MQIEFWPVVNRTDGVVSLQQLTSSEVDAVWRGILNRSLEVIPSGKRLAAAACALRRLESKETEQDNARFFVVVTRQQFVRVDFRENNKL